MGWPGPRASRGRGLEEQLGPVGDVHLVVDARALLAEVRAAPVGHPAPQTSGGVRGTVQRGRSSPAARSAQATSSKAPAAAAERSSPGVQAAPVDGREQVEGRGDRPRGACCSTRARAALERGPAAPCRPRRGLEALHEVHVLPTGLIHRTCSEAREPDVAARRAELDLVLPRAPPRTPPALVVAREVASRREPEGDAPLLARRQDRSRSKPRSSLSGVAALRRDRAHVELHHLVARRGRPCSSRRRETSSGVGRADRAPSTAAGPSTRSACTRGRGRTG